MRATAVLRLALRRLRRPGSGSVLALVGVAAATAFLAAVVLGSGVAQERSAGRAIERVPAAARAVRAVWFGIPEGAAERWPALDRTARAALRPVGLGTPRALVLFRESTVAGRFVGIAGVEGLAGQVELRSGRLPRRCTAARCEVLRLRGAGRLPSAPGLRLVQVGTAVLPSSVLFGDFLEPVDNALADAVVAPALARAARYHRPAPAPLVVADGVAALAASPVLARSYRSYAWVLPLHSGAPRGWALSALVASADRAQAALRTSSSSWSLTAPTQELLDARAEARVAGSRLVLVGGQGAALLLAFALLAAGTMRDDVAAARRRLRWNGARRWQTRLLAGAESLGIGLGGALAGWCSGLLLGVAVARAADLPTTSLLRETLLDPTGLVLVVGAGLVATAALWAVVSGEPGRSRAGWLAAAVLGALALTAALLLGGALDVERLRADRGAALVLLLLPGLVGFVAAVGVALLLPLVGRRVSALGGRGRRPAVALTGAGLDRGAGAFAAAFLTVAVGLAVFAAGYRTTLDRGERDQAAFRVPTDVLVQESLATLVPVDEVATPTRLTRLVGPGRWSRVLRLSAGAGAGTRIGGATVLGLPPAALDGLPLWRASWGPSPARLRELVRPRVDPSPRGASLGSRRELVAALGPTPLGLRAVVRAPDGRYGTVDLGPGDTRRASVVRAALPPSLRGGTLVALDLVAHTRLIERGADAGLGQAGTLTVRIPGLDLRRWLGEQGATLRPEPGGVRVAYVLTPGRRTRIRARQPSDDELPRVVATPDLVALAGGLGRPLPLFLGGERVLVRVVGEVGRFPGAGADAVVGDAAALRSAVDAAVPGAGEQTEAWLRPAPGDEPRVVAALARRPFSALQTTVRSQLVADAGSDALARGTLASLLGGALLALALGVVALVLVVRVALRDEAGELLDLEALGASPGTLLRVVRARVLALGVLGATAGVATGLALLGLVTRAVSVTSTAQAPDPPLVVSVQPAPLVAVLGLFSALAVAAVVVVSRRGVPDPGGAS